MAVTGIPIHVKQQVTYIFCNGLVRMAATGIPIQLERLLRMAISIFCNGLIRMAVSGIGKHVLQFFFFIMAASMIDVKCSYGV
jgi:hypothetical protein